MPCSSPATGTGRMPAARASVSRPMYVGDSTATGAPGGTSARSAVDRPACPPGTTRTSAGSTPTSAASAARSEASPASGGRSQAPGRRAARASASANARVGCSSGSRYPCDSDRMPGSGTASCRHISPASTIRSASATVCQPKSATAAGRAGTGAAT